MRPPGTYFEFFGCVIGACAGLYIFFLYHMLGAGDIKLIAVCMGMLGVRNGILVIFSGFLLVLLHYLGKYIRNGVFWGQKIRLAPYLFGGYCLCLAGMQICAR